MSSPRFRLAPLFLLALATCTDSPTAPSPLLLKASQNVVAGEELKPRFLFLPPLGPKVRLDGTFDGSLQPVIEVCEWSSGSCAGAIVARFTTMAGPDQIGVFGTHQGEDGKGKGGSDKKGTGSELRGSEGQGGGDIQHADHDPDASDGFYGVDWNTSHSTIVVGKIYRLRTLLGDTELGHVDVQFSTNGSGNDDDEGSRDAGGSTSAAGIITARKDRTLPIKFWIEKPLQRITVVLGRGVTGSPAALDSMFRFRSTLSYNFKAMEGFENVQVSLDGRLVPRFGRVVADTSHILYATVDRIVTLTPELQPLYQMAHGTLSAADPVVATQAYLDQAGEYVRAHDTEAALLQLRDVNYLAFDQLRDSAAVRRLDAALANHVFQIADGNATPAPSPIVKAASPLLSAGGLRLAFSVGLSRSDSLERTDFVYVNGIFTSIGERFTTLGELQRVRHEIVRFQDTRIFEMKAFLNRTRSDQVPESHCLASFWSFVDSRFMGLNSAAGYMAACMGVATYRRWTAADLVESTRQTLNILMRADAPEPDALLLADSIQAWRDLGHHVILLPHSQGNLMAIQAIHRLRSVTEQYVPRRDSTCIGAVSLASPLSVGWELPEHYLAHVVVRGDLVPDLIPFANNWDRIDTDSTQATFLERLGFFSFAQSVHLHNINTSYLTVQARDSVKAGMNEVYDACAIDHIDILPFSLVLSPGQTTLLFPNLINKYGDTLAGRLVDWSSSNSQVATASSFATTAGQIGAVAAGNALVTAANHGASTGVPVTVFQPVLQIFPSSYTASMPAGFSGDDSSRQGCPPDAPITFTVKFFGNAVTGQAVVFDDFDGGQHLVAAIYKELFSPSGVSIRGGTIFILFWNADRSQLSGTVFHQIWTCGVGWSDRTDPITFNRVGS